MNHPDILPAPVLPQSLQAPQPRPERELIFHKWRAERDAFHRLLPELLREFPEKYVAIHDGRVVGSGDREVDVALAARAKFGRVPIYVGLATKRPIPPVRFTSPLVRRMKEGV